MIDRAQLEQRLQQAETHVAKGKQNFKKQHDLIRRLGARRSRYVASRTYLQLFEEMQGGSQKAGRDRLLKVLAVTRLIEEQIGNSSSRAIVIRQNMKRCVSCREI